ncbi:uncharacterized protein LOC116843454 isoform X2 [Odontomachus brunneus]|uniref:uncharacterized protein LOC116843454 isoform X2 n=1 Tax=Odontomachus brunneus TaxID=486640 RepID=UPI0013F23CBA|nr:uncharacterized protein LOC116843454 isoform X2 [Odontomachus brunneus]
MVKESFANGTTTTTTATTTTRGTHVPGLRARPEESREGSAARERGRKSDAVGMAEDSADSSLLTSAIEEDSRKVYSLFPTEARFPYRESPDSGARFEVELCNDDALRTRGRDPSDELLSEYAEFDCYGDPYGKRGVRSWLSQSCPRLSRICNWFPKMCSCIDGSSTLPGNRPSGQVGSYERLGSGPTIFELSSTMQRTRRRNQHREQDLLDSERQEELRFYNGDHTWTTVVVEKNLRTIDLCELLKVKRNAIGSAWSIIETWPELGIERTLEDHEDILAVHRELEMFASGHERRFYFSEDFLKYELFINPKQFFPADMVVFPSGEDRGIFSNVETALRNYLSREDGECPQVFSLVWMRHEGSNTWKKTYMLLQGRKLYTSKKVSPFSAFQNRLP